MAVREGNWWSRAWGAVAVLGFALLAGAAVYEAALIAPLWTVAPPDSVRDYVAQPLRPDSSALFQPLVAVTCVATVVAWLSGLLERGWRRWWLTLAVLAAGALGVVTVTLVLPCERELLAAASADRDPALVVAQAGEWIRAAIYRMAAIAVGGWAAYRAQLAGMLGDLASARRADEAAKTAAARAARDFAFGDEEDDDEDGQGTAAAPARKGPSPRDRWRGTLPRRRRTAKK